MKKIIRTFVFSVVALYLTSLWNGGFSIKGDVFVFVEFAIAFTIVFLVIRPILRLVLFPVNFLTFGIVGSVLNFLLFYLVFYLFPEFKISAWTFPGGNFLGTQLPKVYLSSTVNFLVVIISISFLTSLFETFL